MRRGLVALALLAVLGGATASWQRAGAAANATAAATADDAGVPTLVVARTTFVRRVTADGSLRAVVATPVVTPDDLPRSPKLSWLADDGTVVHEGDLVARLDPTDASSQLREATVNLEAADTSVRAEQLKSATDIRSRANDLQIAADDFAQQTKFQPTDPQIYSKNQIREAQIDLEVAAARAAQAELAARLGHATSGESVELVALDRARIKLDLDRAKDALAKMEVRAPSDGVLVLTRDPWTGEPPKAGDEMWSGRELASIPDPSAMEAELFVLEVDGDGLAEGQLADVTLVSHPDQPYRGTVRLVDKLAKPRVAGVPVQYFSVVVAFERTDRSAMKPGGRVRAEVAISSQDAIVVPRQAVIERDGHTTVFRRGAHGFEPVAVELGAATAGRVVVTRGLSEGDVIALRDPQTKEQQSP